MATRATQEELPLGAEAAAPQSPDFAESGTGRPSAGTLAAPQAAGPIAPAGGQPAGALSGRIVFTSAGHGWTWGSSSWFTQRGVNNEICEDFGNLDQMTMFAFYCFNAGATVVPFRPIGYQTNQVVLDNDAGAVTFAGSWSDSTSTIFYGSAGDVPYRYADFAANETATATYTPNIPVAGFYPVYTWVRHASDRGDQLYRIRHTGGESQVRVPHHMVGNGWVYLGTYYFNAGSDSARGAAVISNRRSTGAGSLVIADAIRFGNGMGNVNRGGGVSGYPREDEASRYWVQRSLGEGQSSSLYDVPGFDDQDDNVGTPPRMAAEMNREAAGDMYKRIYIGIHSNGGGGRGAVGLYRSDSEKTPHQQRLAYLVGHEINVDLESIPAPPLEVLWDSNRASESYPGIYGEINASVINNEMDATIVETGFHDQVDDAKVLRDPKGRNWIARAIYHAVIKYMNEFDSLPLDFLPEPPLNVRAIAVADGIKISWAGPGTQAGSKPATGYVVYSSTNGYGFGNPVGVSGGSTHTLTLTNLLPDVVYYFRVAATNAGGESLPSETVACRRASTPAARALFVNGFDRFERQQALRQTPAAQNYAPPGNAGSMVRVIPRTINSFDYIITHAEGFDAYGLAFDSCQNEAVTNDAVALADYPIVIWACGNESTADETFSADEQGQLAAFLAGGGHLFVSGSDIGYDLDRGSGPMAADRDFLHNQLHAAFSANNSGDYTVIPQAGSIFDGRTDLTFDDGTEGIYWVKTPDVIVPNGPGASVAMTYSGGTGGASAIQYDGSAGGGKVVYFAFPFETVTNVTRRKNYLADILDFFTAAPSPPSIAAIGLSAPGQLQLTLTSQAGSTLAVWRSGDLLAWEWFTNIPNPSGTVQLIDAIPPGGAQRFYRAQVAP